MTLSFTKSAAPAAKHVAVRSVQSKPAVQPAPLPDPMGESTKPGASVATAAAGQRTIGRTLPKPVTAPRATGAARKAPAPQRPAPSSGAARVEEVAARPVPEYAEREVFQTFKDEFVEWFETHPPRDGKGPEIDPFLRPTRTPIVVPNGVDPQYYAWLRQEPQDGVRRAELRRIDTWANGGVPVHSARPGK